MADPIKQFVVKPLIELPSVAGYNVDFTNSSLAMVLAVVCSLLLLQVGMRGRALIPNRWQSLSELTYQFVASTVRDNVGNDGKPYFPFIFTLFMFLLFCNLLGMVPYPNGFTATSHIIVTFALAGFIFLAVTLIAIAKHGRHFFAHFLPHGTPIVMAPMMILIEIISYLSRPISLSLRLAANMIAGHILIKIIALFVVMAGYFFFAPLVVLVVFTGFEVGVAILHAYIFTILTCVYLNDALHLH